MTTPARKHPTPTPALTLPTPAIVEHYGDRLHEAAHGVECDCRPQVRRQFRLYVEAVLTWLAVDGRLTEPNGDG